MENLLNEKQAAIILGRSVSTMQADRFYGRGPAYIKFGRSVRYCLPDLEKFIEKHRVTPDNEEATS